MSIIFPGSQADAQHYEALLAEARSIKGVSLWLDAWRRLRRNLAETAKAYNQNASVQIVRELHAIQRGFRMGEQAAQHDGDAIVSWRRVPVADGVELHLRDDPLLTREDSIVALREAVRTALGRAEVR